MISGGPFPPPFTYSVYPPVEHLLLDYIAYKGWEEVVYVHDGDNGEEGVRQTTFDNSPFSRSHSSRTVHSVGSETIRRESNGIKSGTD